MLDRHFRKQATRGETRIDPERKERTYDYLRTSVWQVVKNAPYAQPLDRSCRTDLERDELLAVSRIPFTPSWQAETLYDAQSVELMSG